MRKPTPIKPMGVSINDTVWRRIARWLGKLLLSLAFAVLMAVFLLEWMAGCGETYIDAKGVRHVNQCLFINR